MRTVVAAILIAALGAAAGSPSAAATAPARTVEEVIARNVAARGGLDAWRKVDTMVWLGHIERADTKDTKRVPFVMQLKRPNLTRFELKQQFEQFTRIFDGTHGWKIRPAGDGRPDSKPFSKEEIEFAKAEFVVDGPLIDYQAKGVKATLDGLDKVEDKTAYLVSLTLPSGAERKVWIDVVTNLEVRYDRPATNPLVAGKPVSMYYRGYEQADGLSIPRRIEVSGAADKPISQVADRLVIDRVIVNAKFEPGTFLPPAAPIRRGSNKIRIGDGGAAVPPQ